MIKCPNCSADLKFNVDEQQIKCKYCGSKFDPKTLNIETKKAKETEKPKKEHTEEKYSGKSYNCSQCGATLLTFNETAITFCSYCGSQAMIESKLIKHNNPQYIIPFKITKEACIENYKKKIKKSIFAPNYMKSDIVVSKFRGIYIPYCVYKVSCHGEVNNSGTIYSHRIGDYEYYDTYKITSQVDSDFEGMSFDIVSNLYDKFSHSIPHDFREVEVFNTNYLAGFYADSADVEDTVYEDNAEKIANDESTKYLSKYKEYRLHGCDKPTAKFKTTEKKTGMFPLYFLAIRDKTNTYVNYAIVNGQTGKIVADIPVDFKKYIITTLLLAIPIYLIINWQLLLLPNQVCIFSMVSAIINVIISIIQQRQAHNRETNALDEGYMNKKPLTNEQKKFKIKFKDLIKQVLAIILCITILVLNPVDDFYYYGGAIATLILVVLSFIDLIKEHNLIVSTKLPQLEKRGGSEYETK